MTRMIAFLAATLVILVAPHPAAAQPAERVYRVGIVWPAPASSSLIAIRFKPFLQGLHDLGYIEGRNISLLYRIPKGKGDRYTEIAALAADLVRQKVDVIVTVGTIPAKAAHDVTRSIPIVSAVSGNYVARGLIKSLRRPGGNLTGFTAIARDLVGKQLQIFKEAVPGLSRVGLLWNPGNGGHAGNVKQAKQAATKLGLRLVPVDMESAAALPRAFRRLVAEKADGVLILRGGLLVSMRPRISDLANEAGLPTMFGHPVEAKAGGLMSYGTNVLALFRRSATYVDKILNGADPAEMPVQRPTEFDLTVNLKTAKALGITFPPAILFRATEVIE